MLARFVTLTLVLTPVTLGPARGAEAIPEHVPPALRPFAPLVGTSWIGRFPDGDLTDEQRFEWVYGGRFLRNTHRVRNAAGDVVYEGETIFAWDPSNDRIAWWYWNTTGGHITGTMVETEQGWISEGENHAPSGQTPRVRGAMAEITSDSWKSVQYFERDGAWIEQWTTTYRPMEGSDVPPGASASPLRPSAPLESHGRRSRTPRRCGT